MENEITGHMDEAKCGMNKIKENMAIHILKLEAMKEEVRSQRPKERVEDSRSLEVTPHLLQRYYHFLQPGRYEYREYE